MKPQQPNIDWVLKNRDLVMQWHKERGGWQEGDQGIGVLTTNKGTVGVIHRHRTTDTEGYYVTGWAVSEPFCGTLHWYCNKEKRISEDWVWMPSSDDVLEMLEKATDRLRQRGRADWLRVEYDSANQSNPWRCSIVELSNEGERTVLATPRNRSSLIALMELLKSLEGKNG